MKMNQLRRMIAGGLLACWGAICPLTASAQEPATWAVYIGTRGDDTRGIFRSVLNAAEGTLGEPELAAETISPAFLAIHPNRRFLYAVGEAGRLDGNPVGAVVAFAIDSESGKLARLNHQLSGGRGPCHLMVDHAGRNVLVANYWAGTAAVLPIEPDGRLRPASSVVQHAGEGVHPQRQTGPHAHSINLDLANRFAFVADLGLDQVFVYRFSSEAGTLAPNEPAGVKVAPGSGPRHFAFHPTGRFTYVINELDSTITAFAYDAQQGVLNAIHTVPTLPAEFEGVNTTAEVLVHPSGKFLYGSNRGHDSLARFRIDEETGRLTPLGHTSSGGEMPRNFAMDPLGRFILVENQASNSVLVFRIDLETGDLKPTDSRITVPSPTCIRMIPLGQ